MMRYADMIWQLKRHGWPKDIYQDGWLEKDQPVRVDAVLKLSPLVDGCAPWLPHSAVAETPVEIAGMYKQDYLAAALPMPPELVPKHITVAGYDLGKNNWPQTIEQVMPDFYELRANQIIISDVARDFFQGEVPGEVGFVEIDVRTPLEMVRAKKYFYLNVLRRSQQIDWGSVNGGKLDQNLECSVSFKSFGALDPLLWHEMSPFDPPHQFGQSNLLVRGKLWNRLIEEFPLQLYGLQISRP